jgi:hypothetical protein
MPDANETVLYVRETKGEDIAPTTDHKRKPDVSESKVADDSLSLPGEQSRGMGMSSRLPEYYNSSKKVVGKLTRDVSVPLQPFTIRSDLFDPILAVHSNQFVEKKREDIRALSRKLNPRFTVINPPTDPTLSRPTWPFLPWDQSPIRPNINPDAFLSEVDKTYDPHERHESERGDILEDILNVERQNINFDFAHFVLEKERDNFCTELPSENEKIRKDVRTILERACEDLSKRHKIFGTFSIMEMGSVAEGTKLGPPDEFDFMVDLPCLNNALDFVDEKTFFKDHEYREIHVKNKDDFQDFEELSEEIAQEGDDKSFMQRVWNTVQIKLADAMEANVLPGWRWLDTVLPIMTLAQTQKLLWKGDEYLHLIVDVDICICVKPPEFDTNIDFNQEIFDKSRPGIRDKETSKTGESLKNIYLLLKSDGKARWTRALMEKKIWARFPPNDGRKIVLRSLKYCNSKFLPKCYNESLFRLDAALPSYWLKTVMYYLITWYHEESDWSPDNLDLRFIEVWFVLRECLRKKHLSSYFVPHNVISKHSDVKKLLTEICKVTDEYLSGKLTKTDIRGIENEIEITNHRAREEGVFSSVIELCYFYGYNDFADENKKALESFIAEFGNGQYALEGEGRAFKITYRNAAVDIDRNISERYGEKEAYFS